MCRNIKPLFNYEPPATDEEIRAAAIQFVRKISGITNSSRAYEAIMEKAVNQISENVNELLYSLVTSAKPKNREKEAEKAKVRYKKRYNRAGQN